MQALFEGEGEGEDLFSFQPIKGPRCLAFIPFKLRGVERNFFFSVLHVS